MSLLLISVLNLISNSWLVPVSFRILSEDSSFPFPWGLFPCLPIVCETLLVSLCFLNWSVLTSWVCDVNFYGRRPVRFSSAVSWISWSCCSWDAVYVDSLDEIGFWLVLGHSLVDLPFQLVGWGSLRPPRLVCCCAGAARRKTQSPENKPTSTKISPPCNSVSMVNEPVLIRV